MAPKKTTGKACSTNGPASPLCTSASHRAPPFKPAAPPQRAQQGKYVYFRSTRCAIKGCDWRKFCRTKKEADEFWTNGGKCGNPMCASAHAHLSPMKSTPAASSTGHGPSTPPTVSKSGPTVHALEGEELKQTLREQEAKIMALKQQVSRMDKEMKQLMAQVNDIDLDNECISFPCRGSVPCCCEL